MRIAAESALLTDLYQPDHAAGLLDEGMTETAVFEFFVRKLPAGRNFLVAAGLEQALDFLENLAFAPEELDWLAGCGRFRRDFVDSLAGLRFTGDVQAMAEGTVFFPDEPILRVVAPLREAQLIETRLINLLQFQTLVAAKATRVRLVAGDRLLVDFGLRRAHGAEAGLLSARAACLGGFDGSSNVLAGMRWNIPVFGTMAHSYIQTHDSEVAAFERFARSHPLGTTLLIDTYDTEAAARPWYRWRTGSRPKGSPSARCASTAATSASTPGGFAPSSTTAVPGPSASSPAATSTSRRCGRW